jgi:hypothetical protein
MESQDAVREFNLVASKAAEVARDYLNVWEAIQFEVISDPTISHLSGSVHNLIMALKLLETNMHKITRLNGHG